MANGKVELPAQYFGNPSIGRALGGGSLYIGESDKDPEINPIQVFAVQEDGTRVPIAQPVTLSAGGYPQYNGSPVQIEAENTVYSLRVRSSSGAEEYYFPITDGREVLSGYTIVKHKPALSIGQNQFTVPDQPAFINVFVNGDLLQESDNDYTYNATTGQVTLGAPYEADDVCEVQSYTAVGYLPPEPLAIQSVVHIAEFTAEAADDVEALENACSAGEKVLFGGYNLNIDRDFNYPGTGKAIEFDLQGSTISTVNNSQLLNMPPVFKMKNGVFDGGLKQAAVASVFDTDGVTQEIPFADTSQFNIGDNIACSIDNRFLPNSSTRINNPPTYPLTGFPEVVAKTSNSLTIRLPGVANEAIPADRPNITGVGSVLPEGMIFTNARFDKTNLQFNNHEQVIFEDMKFQNLANAYAFRADDENELGGVWMIRSEINNSALDAMYMRGGSLIFQDCKLDTLVEIGKQVVVWGNTTNRGKLVFEECDVVPNNTDGILYGIPDNGSKSVMPHVYIRNTRFDGRNKREFFPRTQYSGDTLNFVGYSGGLDEVDFGFVLVENGRFLGFERHLFGSTFAPPTTLKQGKITFINSYCECDPFFSSSTNNEIEPISYQNTYIRGTLSRLGIGAPNLVYDNCRIVENFPEDKSAFSESSNTITRFYTRGDYILQTTSGNKYQVINISTEPGDLLTDTSKFLQIGTDISTGTFVNRTQIVGRYVIESSNCRFEDVILPNRSSESTIPLVTQFYAEGVDSHFILEDADLSATSFNLNDWIVFSSDEQDSYGFKFKIKRSDVVVEYGGTEGFGEEEWRFNYKNRRQNFSIGSTAPLPVIGAFAVNPPIGSVVHGVRDRGSQYIESTHAVSITSGVQGESTIDYSAISGASGERLDWIAVVNATKVYFYQVESDNGSTLTISETLDVDLDGDTTAYLIKHDMLIVENALRFVSGSGTPVGNVLPDFRGQFYQDTATDDLYMSYGKDDNTQWKNIG